MAVLAWNSCMTMSFWSFVIHVLHFGNVSAYQWDFRTNATSTNSTVLCAKMNLWHLRWKEINIPIMEFQVILFASIVPLFCQNRGQVHCFLLYCTRNSFNEIQIYSAVRFVYFENFSLQMEALERGRKHHNRFIVVPNIVPKSIFPLNGPRLIEKKVECL